MQRMTEMAMLVLTMTIPAVEVSMLIRKKVTTTTVARSVRIQVTQMMCLESVQVQTRILPLVTPSTQIVHSEEKARNRVVLDIQMLHHAARMPMVWMRIQI